MDAPARQPSGWCRPFARVEGVWTSLEARLCAAVLLAETFALCLWIAFKGLSTPTSADNQAGLVFRALLGALALGAVAWAAGRRAKPLPRRVATVAGVVIGLGVAPLWRTVGVAYFANVLTWLQDASSLTLIGGLRGLGTRLTLWLALLGASLATASGKHISIDVGVRFLPPRLRPWAISFGAVAAALVCFTAAWGFFDHISIDGFGAAAGASAPAKVARVREESWRHFFLLRRQLALDLRTLPKVAAGRPYASSLSGAEWNEWLEGGGFGSHFSPEEVASLRVPQDALAEPHAPLVVIPHGTSRGGLVHDLNLVLPFGLAMIGLRFLLRVVLAAGRYVRLDPDAAHGDEDLEAGTTGGEA